MYKDLKVTSGEVAANNVKSAPDRLQGTATENKNVFDKLVELFVGKYNDLLDELDDNEMSAVPPITINGYTISHANSGVTQGMYGTDQEQDPQHGEKFIIPYFITDEHGHIVSAGNSEVQLPSGGGGGTTGYGFLYPYDYSYDYSAPYSADTILNEVFEYLGYDNDEYCTEMMEMEIIETLYNNYL